MRFSAWATVGFLISACGGKVAVDRTEDPPPRLEPTEGFTCDELEPSESLYYCLGAAADGCEPPGAFTLDARIRAALLSELLDGYSSCLDQVKAEIDGQDAESCAPDNQGLNAVKRCSADASCWCDVTFAGVTCGPDPGRDDLCCYFVRTREEQFSCD